MGFLSVTLKQIEAFYRAAKLGSFAIAAQRLHVTQSSPSKRIAELESAEEGARPAFPAESGQGSAGLPGQSRAG
jgi:hypothetical protein